MKKIIFGCYGTLLAFFSFFSCSPIYYSPSTHHVPMLSEKNQANLVTAVNENRLELQMAYGVADHIGVMLNGGYFFPESDEQSDGGKGAFVEAGVGYFTTTFKRFLFDTYAVVCYGNFSNHFPSTLSANPGTTGDIKGKLIRYGLQPSFGYNTKYFQAVFSTRIVGLSYFNVDGSLIFDGQDQVQYLAKEKNHFLVEPALTIRGGLSKVKLQLQYGKSFNVTSPDFRQDNEYLTLGLVVTVPIVKGI